MKNILFAALVLFAAQAANAQDNYRAPNNTTMLASDRMPDGVHVPRTKVQTGGDGTAQDVSNDNPFPTSNKGSPSFQTGQVSVGTTATLVVAARPGRAWLNVSFHAANTCAVGNASVTLTTGAKLEPISGAQYSVPTSGALYAVCNAVTPSSWIETF